MKDFITEGKKGQERGQEEILPFTEEKGNNSKMERDRGSTGWERGRGSTGKVSSVKGSRILFLMLPTLHIKM